MAFQGLLSPISQSVFPYVNKLLKESYQEFIIFNKKLFKIALFLGVIISSTLFLFAIPIVHIILGSDYQPSILILRIIAWLPLIIFLSNVLGKDLDSSKKIKGENAEYTKSDSRNTFSGFLEHVLNYNDWILTAGILVNHISESELGVNFLR